MHGNLMNRIAERSRQPEPRVGLGATRTMYSDRKAGTVVHVTASGKTVTWQRDFARRVDSNGMSDSQEYVYERNPEGGKVKFRLTKRGWRSPAGDGLVVGVRDEYHDFTF